MSDDMKQDFTRWNRAGLSRFDYLDTNAVTLLESLREDMAEAFPQWQAMQLQNADEDLKEQGLRLLEQYRAEPGDMGWELMRAFARASHVLARHMDAYANEAYLRTAAHWDNVRRLVAMLDHHPRPAASASTALVLSAKKAGMVEQGFKVKYAPEDGGDQIVFETLQDIEIHPQLDALRITGWGQLDGVLGMGMQWYADPDEAIGKGQHALVWDADGNGALFEERVDDFDPQSGAINLTHQRWSQLPRESARLLVNPKFSRAPALNGESVREFAQNPGLAVGECLAWDDAGTWRAAQVVAAEDRRVDLQGNLSGLGDAEGVYRLLRVEAPVAGGFDVSVSVLNGNLYAKTGGSLSVLSVNVDYSSENGVATISAGRSEVWFIHSGAKDLGTPRTVAADRLWLPGKPGPLLAGEPVLLADADDQMSARRVLSLTAEGKGFELLLEGGSASAVSRIFGDFEFEIAPPGVGRSDTPLAEVALWDSTVAPPYGFEVVEGDGAYDQMLGVYVPAQSVLMPEPGMAETVGQTPSRLSQLYLDDTALDDEARELLSYGRKVIIERQTETGFSDAVEVLVKAFNGRELVFDPPLDPTGFMRGDTVIRANVVAAGHGEQRPERVLGSGEATRDNASYELAVSGVSFVADASMERGVAAAMTVKVAGRKWTQVSNLRDSGPADHHYEVRVTEDGYCQVRFGDGRKGRRLPSGVNNVKVSFRQGTGPSGNLEAGKLIKPVRPHLRVAEVRQPLVASGGAGVESAEDLRDNAAASLLSLSRAVSVEDFARLARAHTSVAQAAAFTGAIPTGYREAVDVVVVPRGGSDADSITGELTEYLYSHTLPGVAVAVSAYESVVVGFDVRLIVDETAYEFDTVALAVRKALTAAFALDQRKLGEPLYRGDIYRVVESVSGVRSAVCRVGMVDWGIGSTFDADWNGAQFGAGDSVQAATVVKGADGVIKMVRATPRQMIYLDAMADLLVVTKEDEREDNGEVGV